MPTMTENGTERRVVAATLETRERRDDAPAGPGTIVGYAAVFNQDTRVWDFDERIAPGAFAEALRSKPDTRALFNHDPSLVLGRTLSGTLRLFEDARGLRFENDLPDTQVARDLFALIQRGDVSQSSFGFSVAEDEWQRDLEIPIRTITRIGTLYDVSPVTYPAYDQTEVSARALAMARGVSESEALAAAGAIELEAAIEETRSVG